MSIKVVLFSKAYKDGLFPIMLRVTHNRKSKYYKIGDSRFNIDKKQWNQEFGLFKQDKRLTPDYHYLNEYIKAKFSKAQSIADYYEMNEIPWTLPMFESEYLTENNTSTVKEFTQLRISELLRYNKYNTASTYKELIDRCEEYDKNFHTYTFYNIDYPFVEGLYYFLKERGNSNSTIRIRMDALRAILNEAINRDIGAKATYPFSRIYGAKKVFKVSKLKTTAFKRAIPKEYIVKLYEAPLEDAYHIWARNIFMFSFFANGINFKDMALLTKDHIKGDSISFTRAKTNEAIYIPLIQELKDMINYDSQYLLPIIDKPIQRDSLDIYLKERRKLCNRKLKEIAKLLKFPPSLQQITLYYARHSYATIMLHNGASVALISQSLGHKDIKTTQIYLDSFELDVLTEHNQTLLD